MHFLYYTSLWKRCKLKTEDFDGETDSLIRIGLHFKGVFNSITELKKYPEISTQNHFSYFTYDEQPVRMAITLKIHW